MRPPDIRPIVRHPAITVVRLYSWRARISNLLRRLFGEE